MVIAVPFALTHSPWQSLGSPNLLHLPGLPCSGGGRVTLLVKEMQAEVSWWPQGKTVLPRKRTEAGAGTPSEVLPLRACSLLGAVWAVLGGSGELAVLMSLTAAWSTRENPGFRECC